MYIDLLWKRETDGNLNVLCFILYITVRSSRQSVTVSTACYEAIDAIEELSTTHVSQKSESRIERFVILMYDRKSDINAAMREMFTNKSKAIGKILPIKAALQENPLQCQPLVQATCPTPAIYSELRLDKGLAICRYVEAAASLG